MLREAQTGQAVLVSLAVVLAIRWSGDRLGTPRQLALLSAAALVGQAIVVWIVDPGFGGFVLLDFAACRSCSRSGYRPAALTLPQADVSNRLKRALASAGWRSQPRSSRMRSRARAAATLDRLRTEVAVLEPPASSTQVSRNEFSKAGTASISIGFRDSSPKDVLRAYYRGLLTDRGWVETRTRPLNEADPTAFEVCYRRDDLMAQLDLGVNGADTYVLSVDWGIDRC